MPVRLLPTALPWRALLRGTLVGGALLLAACTPAPHTEQARLLHFGTVVDITVRDADAARARAAIAAADQRLGDWHRRWHAWQPSELTALNACLQTGASCTVAADLAQLLHASQQLAAESDDLFNPAMGKRIADWGFLRDNMNAPMAPPAGIDPATLPRLSQLLWVDATHVRSTHPQLALDLGGIAKGWALNELVKDFRARGISSALINLGGDVAAIGDAGGRPWRIGIENHQGGEALAVLSLRDGQMAFSSGDYARRRVPEAAAAATAPPTATPGAAPVPAGSASGSAAPAAGKPVHHIIDPRTGAPATGHHLVTLVGSDGLRLQAATKALLIAGDDWQRYAGKLGTTAAFVVDRDNLRWASRALESQLEPAGTASSQWRPVDLP